jgi:hypothetical protein
MPRLTDLTFEAGRIWFSWQPDREEDFDTDLQFVKDELKEQGRRWSPERKQWSVVNDDEGTKALALVFSNGADMVAMVRRQMDLFTRG